jgi:hypothetical protein
MVLDFCKMDRDSLLIKRVASSEASLNHRPACPGTNHLAEVGMELYAIGLSRRTSPTPGKSTADPPTCPAGRPPRQSAVRNPYLRRFWMLAAAAGLRREARRHSRQDIHTLSVRSGRTARLRVYGPINSSYRSDTRRVPEAPHRNDPRHGRYCTVIRRERNGYPGGEKGGDIGVESAGG